MIRTSKRFAASNAETHRLANMGTAEIHGTGTSEGGVRMVIERNGKGTDSRAVLVMSSKDARDLAKRLEGWAKMAELSASMHVVPVSHAALAKECPVCGSQPFMFCTNVRDGSVHGTRP